MENGVHIDESINVGVVLKGSSVKHVIEVINQNENEEVTMDNGHISPEKYFVEIETNDVVEILSYDFIEEDKTSVQKAPRTRLPTPWLVDCVIF